MREKETKSKRDDDASLSFSSEERVRILFRTPGCVVREQFQKTKKKRSGIHVIERVLSIKEYARAERVPPEHIEMGGDDELAKHTKVRLGGQPRVLLERETISLNFFFFSSRSLFFFLSFLFGGDEKKTH